MTSAHPAFLPLLRFHESLRAGKLHMGKFTFAIATFVLSVSAAAQISSPAADPERMEQRIRALSQFGQNSDGGVDRVAYSDADVAGREFISRPMREVGLSVRTDTAGNITGRRDGTDPQL